MENVAQWEKAERGYTVWADLSKTFIRHADKIWRCRVLIERIAKRCQMIFQSPCFELSFIKIEFKEKGPFIEVEGENCCCVYPSGNRYSDHNVDNTNQAFCLTLCLQAAFDEIEHALKIWEENPEGIALEDIPEAERCFSFKKDLSKFDLYELEIVYRENDTLNHSLLVWTKDPFTAQRQLESQITLFDALVCSPQLVRDGPMFLQKKNISNL